MFKRTKLPCDMTWMQMLADKCGAQRETLTRPITCSRIIRASKHLQMLWDSTANLSAVSSLTGGLKDLRQIIPATLSPFAKNFLVALPITYCCCEHTGLTVFARNDTVVHVAVARATRWPSSHNHRALVAEQLLFANLPPVQGLGQASLGGEYC